ncbi:hypothetical protein AA81_13310 [Petrotoga halophila DSM 16923]|uniref:Uncharacterized protein n=1 Tax=Petrotoga halophila DSM 16923 TaxID=1122953 RepID=A0A2S5E924_9BACT|nr:hypothetical protein AA81_13310 [Petrotoga halophila DSM 16923]
MENVSILTKSIVERRKIDVISVTRDMHALLSINRSSKPFINAWLWSDIRHKNLAKAFKRTMLKRYLRDF